MFLSELLGLADFSGATMHQDQEQDVGRDCLDEEDDHISVPVPWCLRDLADVAPSCVDDCPHFLCPWLGSMISLPNQRVMLNP